MSNMSSFHFSLYAKERIRYKVFLTQYNIILAKGKIGNFLIN